MTALGVGIDCEEVARWRALLPRIAAPSQRRLFAPDERSWCDAQPDRAAAYAACWCVKEATRKAFRPRRGAEFTMRDLSVRWTRRKVSGVDLVGSRGARALPVSVTVSRTDSTVVAVAIAARYR